MSTTATTTVADLSGQTALVTGATSGIGKAAALKLAEHGATVLVHGRDASRGAGVVKQISAYLLTAALAPAMASSGGGVIINMSSMAAAVGLPGGAPTARPGPRWWL